MSITSSERARLWRLANPERTRELNRLAYARNREKIIARSAQWAKDNPERIRELKRQHIARWRAANPEEAKERVRQWKKENPEIVKEHVRLRRARKMGAAGTHTLEQVRARFEVHGNRCVYCGSTDGLTVDHKVPLARGGSDWPANLVPACDGCNRSKHARSFREFVG